MQFVQRLQHGAQAVFCGCITRMYSLFPLLLKRKRDVMQEDVDTKPSKYVLMMWAEHPFETPVHLCVTQACNHIAYWRTGFYFYQEQSDIPMYEIYAEQCAGHLHREALFFLCHACLSDFCQRTCKDVKVRCAADVALTRLRNLVIFAQVDSFFPLLAVAPRSATPLSMLQFVNTHQLREGEIDVENH